MERVSAWKRLAGTGKGALGVLDCGAALGMPRSHGIARGREGITLSWGVLNNSTRLWREQDLGARAWWVHPGGPGCLACPSRHDREGTNLYNPKSGSQPRETITSQMLRPALLIHQDHSGRRSPDPMEGQNLHPHPTAHWDCSQDGYITAPHLPSAGWALARKPGLRGSDTCPTPAPGLGLPHGTGISALHSLGAPQHHPPLHHHLPLEFCTPIQAMWEDR